MALAIDLFCGLGGWAEGLMEAGFDVVGFDNERHMYGDQRYPAQLVVQDVRTLHGSQFKDASLIVASPPCQEYSYMAMPWSRAKQIARALKGQDEFPAGYAGSRTIEELNDLFNQCFRIQREASAAAGRNIPLVVENVRGAQPWVGQARWNFGSYYLWGVVPALMPVVPPRKVLKEGIAHRPDGATNFHSYLNNGRKNDGGSWFNIGSPGQKVTCQNPVNGYKSTGMNWSDRSKRGQDFTRVAGRQNGVKQHGSGREWFAGEGKISRMTSSKSPARKAASAMIAKIPYDLSVHIGLTFIRARQLRLEA